MKALRIIWQGRLQITVVKRYTFWRRCSGGVQTGSGSGRSGNIGFQSIWCRVSKKDKIIYVDYLLKEENLKAIQEYLMKEEQIMIKMIATDLDGTMLKNDWSVSGINAKAVETAQGQGVRWMTVTGRSYRGAMPLMQQYGINCGYVLMNGAEFRDEEGRLIFAEDMDPEKAAKVCRKLDAEGIKFGDQYGSWGLCDYERDEICRFSGRGMAADF